MDKIKGNINESSLNHISVTNLIHEFVQPFDSDLRSAIMAIKKLINKEKYQVDFKLLNNIKKFDKSILSLYDISENDFNREQQAILDLWRQNNFDACERGNKIHLELENSFKNNSEDIKLDKFGLGGSFKLKNECSFLELPRGIFTEYPIQYTSDDNILHISGKPDLLIKDDYDIVIVDHKGLSEDTKIPTINGFKTIKEIQIGDKVFDKHGLPCDVTAKSDVHYNDCYEIIFNNGIKIIADCDHRWFVYYDNKELIFNTKELFDKLNSGEQIFMKPNSGLKTKEINLLSDPYVLGCSLLNNAKIINQDVYNEIKKRESPFFQYRDVIPDIYFRASFKQRLYLLKGIMDCNGAFENDNFIIQCYNNFFKDNCIKLLSTFGIILHVKENTIYFKTKKFNPFLVKKYNIKEDELLLEIKEINKVETVPTYCISVNSPSKSYLCTEYMIPTHNTSKEIKQKGFYDSNNKSYKKMLYPLNNLDDCNYIHYQLQLSLYAWILQQYNSKLNIKDLIINYYDYNNKNTVFHCGYLKDEIERMISFYKKNVIKDLKKERRKPIIY